MSLYKHWNNSSVSSMLTSLSMKILSDIKIRCKWRSQLHLFLLAYPNQLNRFFAIQDHDIV